MCEPRLLHTVLWYFCLLFPFQGINTLHWSLINYFCLFTFSTQLEEAVLIFWHTLYNNLISVTFYKYIDFRFPMGFFFSFVSLLCIFCVMFCFVFVSVFFFFILTGWWFCLPTQCAYLKQCEKEIINKKIQTTFTKNENFKLLQL